MLPPRCLLLLAVSVLSATAFAPLQAQDAARSPLQATLVLERDSLRAGTPVPFVLWLANGSDSEITDLRLQLGSPEFLKLGGQGCTTLPDPKRLDLGSLGPRSVRSWLLCLQVDPEVTEGELNLLFTIEHRSSFVAIEKHVSVGVLGTQSVGGFSLGVVALIVPGLLFFGILQMFELKLPERFTGIDRAAFCVLLSVLLVETADVLGPKHMAWGMSQARFLLLCALAALAAALIVGLVKLKKWLETQDVVSPDPDLHELLSKLMRSHPQGGLSIRKNGEEYVGSGVVQHEGGGSLLLGWFEIATEDEPLRERLLALQSRNEWDELLELARKNGLEITTRNAVKKRGADGQLMDLEDLWIEIPAGTFTSQNRANEDEVPADAPLTIV
jgi:hypothetical protein